MNIDRHSVQFQVFDEACAFIFDFVELIADFTFDLHRRGVQKSKRCVERADTDRSAD